MSRAVVPLDSRGSRIAKHDDNYKKYPTLLAYLQEVHGDQTALTTEAQMMEAKRLYIIEGWPPSKIADKVGTKKHPVPTWVVNRWRTNFGWDEAKEQREFRLYQKVSAGIRRLSPDTAEKRLQGVTTRLEDLLEECIDERTSTGGSFTPSEVKTLVSSAQALQQMRRTQVGKPTSSSTTLLEVQRPEVLPGFLNMLRGLVKVHDDVQDTEIIDADVVDDTDSGSEAEG